ncbi:hypothetical protein RUM43_002861 [Polyplax serrata]|uniref:Cyclic nucleotide-binding domain-containing protein n=1 Tax=Polyplax serrata TaxID=468196 RepID=A0AAN8NZC4_POLSC
MNFDGWQVMTGTGFGDLTVGSFVDIIYVLIFAVLGVLLYIYLISDYSANLSLSGEPRQKFVELAERVNSFLLSQKMLRSERIRVRQFLNLQWERCKGYDFMRRGGLFFDTPKHLLHEASQFTRSRGIHKMKLFRGMEKSVIGSLLDSSFRQVFPPHEVVIYAGEPCHHLMVIEEGCCEVTYGKDVSITKIYAAGQDIGTIELMLGLTSLCHVRTLTHCVILKVSRANLQRALAINPIASRELEETISELKNSEILKSVKRNRPILLHLTVRSTVEKSFYKFQYYRKQSGNADLREPYLKLGLCQYILGTTTILPYGKFMKRWESSRCVFAFLSAMLFPCIPYFQLQFPALYYIGILLDMAACIDLYFRCHVCYFNNKNLLVSHPLWTCGHYMKGSLVLDFVFSFPFDRLMYRPIYDSMGEAYVTSHPIDLLRMLRVGQTYRIPARLATSGVDFLSTPHLFWVIFTEAALTTVFINLLTSILVLMCTNYKKTRDGHYHIVYEESVKEHFEKLLRTFNFTQQPFDVFILNFYWTATTAFGVGFGDITADSESLMIYVIIVLVIAYLYFNYVTVTIATHLTSVNMNLTIYQTRMSHLVSYLKDENVEPLLRKHIVNHFEYIWKKNKGIKAQYVFMNFNSALKDDVMFHLYEETIKGVAAFSNLDPSFHRLLSSCLDEIYFQSGAAIYKPGDIISQFFIVHQGEVTLVGRNEDETNELGRSKIFGLFENVAQGSMNVTAVATKNVTVLGIDALELYQILENIESGLVDHTQNEKQKFTDDLYASNKVKMELEQDAQNYGAAKSKTEIVYFVHRFQKLILLFYVILSLFSANVVTYNLAFQYTDDVMFVVMIIIEILFFAKGFSPGTWTSLENSSATCDSYPRGEYQQRNNKKGLKCQHKIGLVKTKENVHFRYVRTAGFYIDLITVIPFEALCLLAHHEDQHYVYTWLRMVKILRLYHVWYFFNLRFDTLNVNMVFLKITSVAIWTSTLLHQCSCIWFLVSCPKSDCPNSRTWIRVRGGLPRHDYLNCLYFIVVVLTNTGFGDITPHTMYEVIFVTTLFFVSFFYIAIFIGEMVSTSRKYLFSKTNFEFKVDGLKNYLDVNEVSYETRKRIMIYVKNLWRNEKGLQIPQLLKSAPRYLSYEIKLATYGHHINGVLQITDNIT